MAKGRRRRNVRRDSLGRFAATGRAAKKLIKSNAKVGRVGPGHTYHGVKVSGTRTITGRVSLYGSVHVGAKLVR